MTALAMPVPDSWSAVPPPELAGVDLRRCRSWLTFTDAGFRTVFVRATRSGALAMLIAARPRGRTLEALLYRDDREGD